MLLRTGNITSAVAASDVAFELPVVARVRDTSDNDIVIGYKYTTAWESIPGGCSA